MQFSNYKNLNERRKRWHNKSEVVTEKKYQKTIEVHIQFNSKASPTIKTHTQLISEQKNFEPTFNKNCAREAHFSTLPWLEHSLNWPRPTPTHDWWSELVHLNHNIEFVYDTCAYKAGKCDVRVFAGRRKWIRADGRDVH